MTTCINKFKVHSREEQASLLAQKLPNGELWTAKYIEGSNFRNLLIAVGLELSRMEQAQNELYCETQLETTNKLIEEFEEEFGIKKGCLADHGTTLEEKIEAIKLQISLNGTTTKQEFEAIAAVLGIDITVIAGWDKATFPFTFPIYFFENLKWARFTMVVDMAETLTGGFPYTFPFTFVDSNIPIMKCLFNKLKPSNVRIIYINEGEDN